MVGHRCGNVITCFKLCEEVATSAGGFTGNRKRWMPWKRDAGKKKAEYSILQEARMMVRRSKGCSELNIKVDL